LRCFASFRESCGFFEGSRFFRFFEGNFFEETFFEGTSFEGTFFEGTFFEGTFFDAASGKALGSRSLARTFGGALTNRLAGWPTAHTGGHRGNALAAVDTSVPTFPPKSCPPRKSIENADTFSSLTIARKLGPDGE